MVRLRCGGGVRASRRSCGSSWSSRSRWPRPGRSSGGSRGVTRQKAAYCLHVAEAVSDGRLNLKTVARMDDADVALTLTRLKGVGPWTADIYLLMALRRPDVWPAGDIALVHAVRSVKRLRGRASPERVARLADAWRPYRSVAARMMWQDYLAERTRSTS